MLALSMSRASEPWHAQVQVLVSPKFCMMLSTLLKLYGWFSPLLNGGNAIYYQPGRVVKRVK